MARISLILLALCAGFPLLAQDSDALTVASASGKSSLTLYGTLDAGVAHVVGDVKEPCAPATTNFVHLRGRGGADGLTKFQAKAG
jgi:hypothetical protein